MALLNERNRTNKFVHMHFTLVYLTYFIIILSCGNSRTNPKYLHIDSVFVAWNKSTLLSLSNHIISANDSAEKSLYQNRLLAFRSFINIGENVIDVKSIRYQFLKKIALNEIGNRFYIVEANNSGEVVELRNYLINPSIGVVDVYNFTGNQWVKSITEKMTIASYNSLQSYFVDFGSGINQDDVIITLFDDGNMYASEYYLYTTLSKSNPWGKMFLLGK